MPSILLVEDDALTREQMSEILSSRYGSVRTAETGEQGLGLYLREKPDLVITDVLMPGMDGIEMARRIRESDPCARIIVMTAYTDLDDFSGPKPVALDYVWKPVNVDALFNTIDECIERQYPLTDTP